MILALTRGSFRLFTKVLPVSSTVLFYTLAVAQPVINSFSPQSGRSGIEIIVQGSGFNTSEANNVVWFGATKARLTSGNTDQLIVTVPEGATYDYISVTDRATALTGFSNAKFVPTFDGGGAIVEGSFASQVAFPADANPRGIAMGDLDGDGKPDLAVANYGANTVSVYRNTSTAGSITTSWFANRVTFSVGSFPTDVAIGDIDGDGKSDLVVSNQSSSNVSVLRNVSTSGIMTTSSFQSHVTFSSGAGQKVAIADIDGDGKPDIVVANGVSNTISLLRNTSASGSLTTGSFASQVALSVNSVPGSVAIGDLDGDGKPDLAVTRRDDNSVAIFRNTSTRGSLTTSSFAAQVSVSLGASPRDVALGDVDEDGKLDIAVSHSGTSTVSVVRNNSSSGNITSGTFSTPVLFTVGSTPTRIAFGDLNGDVKIDLAVVNMNSGAVSVLQNTGVNGGITTGSFGSQVLFGTGSGPQFLALGDVDSDGKPEMIATNEGNNSVSVLRNEIVSPVVTIEGPVSTFTTNIGSPSATQNVTVSGSELSANLIVTAPSGYELRNGASGAFSNSVSIAPAGGNVPRSTIQVRLTGSSAGSFNGNITATSTGATDQTLAVTGTVSNGATRVTLSANSALFPDTLMPGHVVQLQGTYSGGTIEGLRENESSTLFFTNAGGDYWTLSFDAPPGGTLSYKIWAGKDLSTPLSNRGNGYDLQGIEAGDFRTLTIGADPVSEEIWLGNTANVSPLIPQSGKTAVYLRVNVGSLVQKNLFAPGADPVQVRGSILPATWDDATGITLTEEPFRNGDNYIYSGLAYFDRSLLSTPFEYKFHANGWENDAVSDNPGVTVNRIARLSNDTTLHLKFFSNEKPLDGTLEQVDLPVTFESTNTNYALVDFGGVFSDLIEDPSGSANRIVRTRKLNGAEFWAGTTVGGPAGLKNPIPFTATNRKMMVRVLSPDAGIPVRLKVETAGDQSRSVETDVLTTKAGEWETLTFDFNDHVAGTAPFNTEYVYNMVSIFFNFGTTGADAGDKTYYWDDLAISTETVPSITASLEFFNVFETTPAAPSEVQSIVINGANLVGNIDVSVTGGFEIATAEAPSNWSTFIALIPQSGAVVDRTVLVRLKGGLSAGTVNETLALLSDGAEDLEIPLSGTVQPASPPQITTNGALASFSTVNGTDSPVQTYTVSAAGVSSNLVISAPHGFEIGTGAAFASTLTIPSIGGNVALTTVSVRLRGAGFGQFDGNLRHTAGNANTVNLPLTGTIANVEAPIPSTSPVSGVWTRINSPRTSLITALAAGGSTLIAGTAAGASVSSDAGKTWGAVGNALYPQDIFWAGGTTYYMASAQGLHRSTNNGAQWTLIKDGIWGGSYATTNAVYVTGTTIYAGTDNGLFRSTDGINFTKISGASLASLTRVRGLALYQGQLAIWATNGTGSIVVVHDFGSGFSDLTNGVNYPASVNGLTVANGILFAGTENSGLFVVANVNQLLTTGLNASFSSAVTYVNGMYYAAGGWGVATATLPGGPWTNINGNLQGAYVRDIINVDSTVYVAGLRGVWAKTAGASTWVQLANGMAVPEITASLSSPSGNDLLISDLNAGIYRSTDNGRLFTPVFDQGTGTMFVQSNPSGRIMAFGWNTIHTSSDNGNTWSPLSTTGLPDGYKSSALQLANGSVFVAFREWENKGVYRLNGTVWTAANAGLGSLQTRRLVFFDGKIWASTVSGGVFSYDAGTGTWTNAGNATSGFVNQVNDLLVQSTPVPRLLAATTNGIWSRGAGTSSWTQNPGTNGSYLETLHGGALSRLWAVAAYFAMISHDGGDSWNTISPDPGIGSTFVVASNADNVLVMGNAGGVIRPQADFTPVAPVITGLSAGSAPVGTVLTIAGTGFSTVATNNFVYFGEARAVVSGASGTSISVTVPQEIADEGVVDIRVRVNGITATSERKFVVVKSVVVNVTQPQFTNLPDLNGVDNPAPTQYRLVGLPGKGFSPSDAGLSEQDDRQWRAFRDPGSGALSEMSPTTRTRLGEGAWLISRKAPDVAAYQATVSAASQLTVIPVRPNAWNIITNPNNGTVTWATIRTANQVLNGADMLASSQLWAFNGTFSQTSSIQAFQGYYLFVPQGVTELAIPFGSFPKQLESPIEITKAELLWSVGMHLKQGDAADLENRIGIASDALAGQDMYDLHKPPLVFDLPYLYFDRPEWNETFPLFASDVRPPFTEGETWTFSIQNPSGKPVELSFSETASVPAGMELLLLHPETGRRYDLKETRAIKLSGFTGQQSFVLVAGTPSYTQTAQESFLPEQLNLFQNYPNPFNPATTIRFSLNKTGNVKLTVFDLNGRKIADIVNGEKPAGYHSVAFHASGLASGIYLYRLETAGQILVKKMVLVK